MQPKCQTCPCVRDVQYVPVGFRVEDLGFGVWGLGISSVFVMCHMSRLHALKKNKGPFPLNVQYVSFNGTSKPAVRATECNRQVLPIRCALCVVDWNSYDCA